MFPGWTWTGVEGIGIATRSGWILWNLNLMIWVKGPTNLPVNISKDVESSMTNASFERSMVWLECNLISFFRPCRSSSITVWLTSTDSISPWHYVGNPVLLGIADVDHGIGVNLVTSRKVSCSYSMCLMLGIASSIVVIDPWPNIRSCVQPLSFYPFLDVLCEKIGLFL